MQHYLMSEEQLNKSKLPLEATALICGTPTPDILHETASDRVITEMLFAWD